MAGQPLWKIANLIEDYPFWGEKSCTFFVWLGEYKFIAGNISIF